MEPKNEMWGALLWVWSAVVLASTIGTVIGHFLLVIFNGA